MRPQGPGGGDVPWLLLFLLCLQVLPAVLGLAQNTIAILASPQNCYGGQPCKTQPSVQVLNSLGQLDIGFVGYAYVQVSSSPGSKAVYLGTCTDLDTSCSSATQIVGTSGRVYFVNGVAQFRNIMFRTAGVGYQLIFYGNAGKGGPDFNFVFSSTFQVQVGEAYRLQFATYIGLAAGGIPFSPNPVIAIVDRGGNQVSALTGTITASLSQSPYLTEKLQTVDTFVEPFGGGLAAFTGLFLNTAGGPYAITFTSNIVIIVDGVSRTLSITSAPFYVVIGAPASLSFVPGTTISSSPVYAGEFFRVTPRVRILDAGGNVVLSDVTSGVTVRIAENPANAILGPSQYLFSVAKFGVVTFTTFLIDKAAAGFRLSFTLSSYSASLNAYTATSIVLISERFDVNIGPPRKLVTSIAGGNSWAGGQPMQIQPVIQVVDYGYNVISTDFSSTTLCSMNPSLSVLRKIVVDTSNTDTTVVKSVGINVGSGTYGTGHVFLISLHFNYEVSVLTQRVPTLLLGITGTSLFASLIGTRRQTKTLVFQYEIAAGDSATVFDYNGIQALSLNGALLVNGNNRTVNTKLPTAGISRNATIRVQTTKPFIKSITTSAPSGTYSVGDTIVLNVTFSAKISVFGSPYINLTATSASGGYVKAVFSSVSSDMLSALFDYTVGPGQSSSGLSVLSMGFPTPNSKVLLFSTNPQTPANVTILSFLATKFKNQHLLVIDTSVPKLSVSYGVKCSQARSTYYIGDVLNLTMQFDHEVSILGSFTVNLKTGAAAPGTALFSKLLSDHKTIVLLYTVTPGDSIAAVDISGSRLAIPSADAYIRRRSLNPTLDADVTTTAIYNSINSLRSLQLQLYGSGAVVASVTLSGTNKVNPTFLTVDDYALLAVTFTAPVLVTCTPVLVMSLNASAKALVRSATYFSGNKTSTLIFKYTVQLGDSSNTGIRYRYSPNALCSTKGCPAVTDCMVLTSSDNPSFPASLLIPTYSDQPLGVPVSTTINIDPGASVKTTHTKVKNITCTSPAGTYGAGNFFTFLVSFVDEVLVTGPEQLLLYTSLGKWATYAGGSGTKTLSFTYATTETDAIVEFSALKIPQTNRALNCSISSCLMNRLFYGLTPTDLTISTIPTNTGIVLNPLPPKIVKVWSDKPVSPYDGVYTVGEVINIYVKFDMDITVSSTYLHLVLDVGGPVRQATYLESSVDYLKFTYVVVAGDQTSNLRVIGSEIDRENGRGAIYRTAAVLATQANYTLPAPAPLIVGGLLAISTADTPRVLYTSAVSPSGLYAAGDVIVFKVVFSHYVVLNGRAVINMNVGDHISQASYSGTNSSNIQAVPTLPSVPSKVFYFQLTVRKGDFNAALDYTDSFSFSLGLTDVGTAGTLLRASSNPSMLCNIDLPQPGSVGSLSKSATLKLDGGTPYLTSIGFASPAGTYGAGQEITIALNFSMKVLVSGSPYIIMETGAVNRLALYKGGSGTSTLAFSYIPEPGDSSTALDYTSNRAKLQSAVDSFQFNGGSIYAASRVPTAAADVYLNPPGGQLLGSLSSTAAGGVYRYLDLLIVQRGPDYQIRFSSSPSSAHRTLTTTQTIFVSFSNEFELRPNEAQIGDLIGSSVSISGSLALVGAPGSNKTVTCVQTVTTTGARAAPTPEIQIFGTHIEPQPAIIKFHTSGGVGSTVGGTFIMAYGVGGSTKIQGPTKPIPADVSALGLQIMLQESIPSLGNVSISREPYIFCACNNAFLWTLTFHDINTGVISQLVFNPAGLTGDATEIVGPTTIQKPAYIGGSMSLKGNNKTSRLIPFDADSVTVASALLDIGYSVIHVEPIPPSLSGSRSWQVTFDEYDGSYDIPMLQSNSSQLTGGTVSTWHILIRQGVHGKGGLHGGFYLQWRGNTTTYLPFDASSSAVKTALEALPVIGKVNVKRSSPSTINAFVWTIEFVEVYQNTPRGYMVQSTQDLEPIVPISALNGTETSISVKTIRQGTFGKFAGASYVFTKNGERWDKIATLGGNDTKALDYFGSSVVINGNIAVIGAIGSAMTGIYEKQVISCSATRGVFRIQFRGWTTADISYNVTRQGLYDAIVAVPGDTPKLAPISEMKIDDWGGGALCNNKKAVLTFWAPLQSNGPGIELITLQNVSLNSQGGAASLEISRIQSSTLHPDGKTAALPSIGSAYVFRTLCLTAACTSHWSQEAQLFPLSTAGGDRFGYSLATTGTVIVAGAPGTNYERGAAYIYDYCNHESPTAKSWKMLQKISYPHANNTKDYFGASVSMDGNTLVVGAPNYLNIGAVFVFKRFGSDCLGNTFAIAQILTPTNLFPLSLGDLYGASVSVSGNFIVVGAPHRDDATIYFGQTVNKVQVDTGSAFVFSRKTTTDDFLFFQRLTPSNVKRGDRFGWSVALDGNVATVGAMEEYIGPLNASRAIIEVKTQSVYNAEPVGTSFRLKWRTSNSTGHILYPETRDIPVNATALEMKTILENDLSTGNLLVSRSDVDEYDNGYSWLITFAGQTNEVSILYADTLLLTGTNASVDIRFVNEYPAELRGNVHVFLNTGSEFVEEFFLSPFSHQPIDRCGSAVAISGNYALVGCPNRDSSVPNFNSGAASVYYLSLLNVQFSSPTYSIVEGNTFSMTVQRNMQTTGGLVDTLFYIETLDRNSVSANSFIEGLYGISSSDLVMYQTARDLSGISGTAVGRSNYYGSFHNESAWVDGMYDYRAISDYVPVYHPWAFLIEYENITDFVVTTADTILELPDENVTIGIHAPGIWPSVLGKLWSVLTIVDPGDGFVNGDTQYDKVYQANPVAGAHTGYSVSVVDEYGVVVSGCPDGFSIASDGTKSQTGLVLIYQKVAGHFIQQATLHSPDGGSAGGRYGDDVIVRAGYERHTSVIIVGEPNRARVHAYVSNNGTSGFVFDYTITADDATLPQHQFGAKGTLGLDGNLLVIGAPGLEAIFVVVRFYDLTLQKWTWQTPLLLRSSDFDYDVIFGTVKLHRQFFGSAVSISSRSIVVGSPFADYDKLGTNLVETDWDTEGSDIFNIAKGKAYVFYSLPAVRVITLDSPSQLTKGTFTISYSHLGMVQNTAQISFSASAADMKLALEALENILSVSVSISAGATLLGSYQYTWTITFQGDWQTPGVLQPQWNGPVGGGTTSYGCAACVRFSDYLPDPSLQMSSSAVSEIFPVTQVQELSASDKRSGNRFGASVAIDGDQIVVGALHSSSVTSTSWDFEAGTLNGWGTTGNAFQYQPTFGDNSYMRPVNPDLSYAIRQIAEHSNVVGNYYIGTYEKHPGSPDDYSIPDPNYPQGSYQGDVPVGTLTSEVFLIHGTKISFLIGGGCDIYTIYVELLVDGFGVARQTGKCAERMHTASFNVSNFQNRAGQLRIVDASSSSWGHINVDHFEFDWDVHGGTFVNTNNKPVVGGVVETPLSGVVYAFLRHSTGSNDLCGDDKSACEWTEEAKLMASDKRANSLFGASVAVDDAAGIVVVGSPYAGRTGFYKEVLSFYPYQNSSGTDDTTLPFPVKSSSADLFQTQPWLTSESSGASAVWSLLRQQSNKYLETDDSLWTESGAVYIFTKDHAVAINGHVSIPQHWPYTEHARVQAPDAQARDYFGQSVALNGNSLVIGSSGNDGIQPDAGAVYVFKTGFSSLYFAREEFAALEGTDNLATITVIRKLETFRGEIVLEYATSDLTAFGVDAVKFAQCQGIAVNLRGPSGCGDYQQTRGNLVIPANVASGGFYVPIVNDNCNERFPKYIQITISVPGSGALQGESVSARLRIDDDDFSAQQCYNMS